jgi:hypothetical protein
VGCQSQPHVGPDGFPLGHYTGKRGARRQWHVHVAMGFQRTECDGQPDRLFGRGPDCKAHAAAGAENTMRLLQGTFGVP